MTGLCIPSMMGPFMSEAVTLQDQIRALVIETLMLPVGPEEVGDERPLFGPEGLGLDSVDALQLVVMLDKHFGLKVTDAEVARKILGSVSSMAAAVEQHRADLP